MRHINSFAAAVFLALGLACAGSAVAAGPDTPPTPSGAAKASVGQIAAPASSTVDVQQTPPAAPESAVSADQLSPMMHRADAPAGPAKVADGSDARVATIKGRDHCDSAAPGGANKTECAKILDAQADSFTTSTTAQPAPVDTRADSSSLVDTIVNGGTGSVVSLPPQQGQPQPQL